MTDSMGYPDPGNRSTIEYQYSPTTVNNTQYSLTILGGEHPTTGAFHCSDVEFNAGIDEPSDDYISNLGLHIPSTSRTSLESRARLSNNMLPSCNCFSSSWSSRQSMGSPLTYSFFQSVDNHRESEDHYQANPVLTDSSQYQFSKSNGRFAPGSSSLNSHCAHSSQPEVYSFINGSMTSSQGLALKSRSFTDRASKPEESDEVFPRVLNDMYDRVEHAFRVLSICLCDSTTADPESYSAEVDAYLSLNEFSYQLFIRGYRAKSFTKSNHEYLVPFYSSIYSQYHRMDIGESDFIRHFVHHAIKRLRWDIRSIEVHELQDAEKAKNYGYSDEYDFNPTENRVIVDMELVNLEKRFRSDIGPF
ncbi:hypothetical protein EYC80_006580 [Monilinia laxa]|uniref:Uncharacterized protein n=1 Tax=Monilinia laxa TaxID=61186 RepID=A0A5N6JT41_MONLA|nr:hypothetical protein EYC80_006580 [Monilinia laxa]